MGLDPCSEDVWFTLRHANKIARVRDFEVTEYDVPLPDAYPIGIDVDLDHNVWVAFSEAAKLGRRSPDGEWRFLDLPDKTSEPRTIYVDPWNDVWFAEKTGNHVGWVDKKNWTVERYEIPTKVAWPLSLLADDDGNLWFAEMRSDKLAMLDRETREITEYSLPVQSAPFKLLFDRENSAMWISTVFYNAILRFDMDQRKLVGIYKVPQEGAWVGGLDRDSEKCIWFSQQFANRIGRLCIEGVSAQTAFQDPPAGAETTVARTASDTVPGESRR
jgi:virginiamycin B lyase